MSQSADSPEQLMRVSEVAVAFRVDPNAVRRWIANGDLAAIRMPGKNGHYRIPRAAVDEALANWRKQPSAGPDPQSQTP